MARVESFSRSMMEKYLQERGLKYLTDRDGDFRVGFTYEQDIGCELTVWLIAGGSRNQIYVVRIRSDKRIPKSDWTRVAMVCNTWNKERRWPKAYLYVRDPNTDTSGEILLEMQIDLQKGIHQELLNDFTDTAIATAYQFWRWAHQEQGI